MCKLTDLTAEEVKLFEGGLATLCHALQGDRTQVWTRWKAGVQATREIERLTKKISAVRELTQKLTATPLCWKE